MKLFSKTSLARLIMLVAIGALLVGCNPDRANGAGRRLGRCFRHRSGG